MRKHTDVKFHSVFEQAVPAALNLGCKFGVYHSSRLNLDLSRIFFSDNLLTSIDQDFFQLRTYLNLAGCIQSVLPLLSKFVYLRCVIFTTIVVYVTCLSGFYMVQHQKFCTALKAGDICQDTDIRFPQTALATHYLYYDTFLNCQSSH